MIYEILPLKPGLNVQDEGGIIMSGIPFLLFRVASFFE